MTFEPITTPDLPTSGRQRVLAHRAQLLAGASVLYNIVEGIVALAAGTVASSSALVSFGLDSAVEVASGLIIQFGRAEGQIKA